MNAFSMEPAFCAVKLSCGEMNKMGFRLAFWRSAAPTLHTHFTFLFYQLCSSSSGTRSLLLLFLFPRLSFCPFHLISLPRPCAHIFPPSCISPAPSFSSPPPLPPCLHMLCLGSFTWLEERMERERRGLVWIIHAAVVVRQSSRDPPDACPPDSLLLSLLPLLTCTCCVCVFFIVCVCIYVWTYVIILEWSQHVLYKGVGSGGSAGLQLSLHMIVFSVFIFLPLMFIICMNSTFLLGLGVSGSCFWGEPD